MLDRVPNFGKKLCAGLMLAIGLALSSCATHKEEPRVVENPDAKQESSIPWNKQEKWEVGADLGPVAGQSGSDRR